MAHLLLLEVSEYLAPFSLLFQDDLLLKMKTHKFGF